MSSLKYYYQDSKGNRSVKEIASRSERKLSFRRTPKLLKRGYNYYFYFIDQSVVMRGNLNDNCLDHDSRQIINNFWSIKKISKNDFPKYLPKDLKRIQKTNDNKPRKSKLPEISLNIEECSQMANNGRSIRYILPSSKNIISKQSSVSSNKNNISKTLLYAILIPNSLNSLIKSLALLMKK